jgi:hypothetical protein
VIDMVRPVQIDSPWARSSEAFFMSASSRPLYIL